MAIPTDEVAGLPEGGPATLEDVKVRLGIDDGDTDSDDRLEMVVAAVNDQVRSWPVAERSAQPDVDLVEREWVYSTVLGAVMLCVRIDNRRNTPDGVAGFADGAPVYVQRNDPDVAMLLQLGQWAKPVAT